MRTCYIASRFRNIPLVNTLTKQMASAGVRAIQTWPSEPLGCDPVVAANRDLREIDEAEFVLVVTQECELVPGGMHFEAGYAYAKGKPLVLVGAPVNIFLRLADLKFDTIEAYLAYLGITA